MVWGEGELGCGRTGDKRWLNPAGQRIAATGTKRCLEQLRMSVGAFCASCVVLSELKRA